MDRHIASAQKGVRKDVERAFGILLSRRHILKHHCMVWDISFIKKVMCTGVNLHNMIFKYHRNGYDS